MRDDKHGLALNEALAMYKRLRERGQNSTLARLSVEACAATELSAQQRRNLRNLLREYESATVSAA